MIQLINGCLYDTQKSTHLATRNTKRIHIKEHLYVTVKKVFFIHHTNLNDPLNTLGDSYIQPVSEKEAQQWISNVPLDAETFKNISQYFSFEAV